MTKVDRERVYFKNPWDQQESMMLDEFSKRLWDAQILPPAPEPKKAAAP